MSASVFVLLVAVALDLLLGDPPNALHPVAWMGGWIRWGERHVPHSGKVVVFLYGTAVVLAGIVCVVLLAAAIQVLLSALPSLVALLASAWLLKTTFALRGLTSAAQSVQSALAAGDLGEARRRLSWHLVSRNTATLGPELVAAATVESVAENFSDGVVAPLLAFALFGLPGALAYRFANTADAMLGYHDARREYFGKFAARLDDVLNLLPARLAAGLLLVGAAFTNEDAPGGWRTLRRDHNHTASPNAGWPMSVMAGALGVTLEKVGHYRLGDGDGALAEHTITRSLRVFAAAALVYVLLLACMLQVLP
jgi:adenosylcobinamide-phosphate synthase